MFSYGFDVVGLFVDVKGFLVFFVLGVDVGFGWVFLNFSGVVYDKGNCDYVDDYEEDDLWD